MQMFMKRAEVRACRRAVVAAAVMGCGPRASRETEITETKVPSMVWGRVKR